MVQLKGGLSDIIHLRQEKSPRQEETRICFFFLRVSAPSRNGGGLDVQGSIHSLPRCCARMTVAGDFVMTAMLGQEGATNYMHMIASGHLLDFPKKWRNLDRYKRDHFAR